MRAYLARYAPASAFDSTRVLSLYSLHVVSLEREAYSLSNRATGVVEEEFLQRVLTSYFMFAAVNCRSFEHPYPTTKNLHCKFPKH